MISLQQGDITRFEGDAIVNAANSKLQGGGGVDGAIHRAGGPEILEECHQWTQKHSHLPAGEAMITTAGKMPATKVIHTVGPVWNGGNHDEEEILAQCYKNSLKLAVEENLNSIAFPNISTGVYGYPKEEAASTAVTAVRNFINSHPSSKMEVYFYCFDDENYQFYKELL